MPTAIAETLTPDQISTAQAQGAAIAASSHQALGATTFVYFATFDGTDNIKTDLAHLYSERFELAL